MFLDLYNQVFKVDVEQVCRFSVAIMVDTEGSEVHTSALETPVKAEVRCFKLFQIGVQFLTICYGLFLLNGSYLTRA
jgi:hypothetical protein